mmetsp:Transcript_32885/g.76796  ORF Transcript_32885/g.76796 Transcript_32885/m.76796 type:complete len:171 (+) Transcript_32885:64-576(+)
MTDGFLPPPTKPAPGLEEWRQRLEAAFRRSATAPALASLVPESTRASECSGQDGPDGASSACEQLDESPNFAEGLPVPVPDTQWEEDFRAELYRLDLERLESEQRLQAQQLEELERLPALQGGVSPELQLCRESVLALRQAHQELRSELAAVVRALPASQQDATTGCQLL